MAVNKVVFGNETLIDLTADTVSADKLASGYTAHDKSGAAIEGTNTYDSDTSDATIAVSEMITGKTAYVRGAKITGSMPNIGTQESEIATKAQEVAISQGYHDGSGSVKIASTEQAKLIPANIKLGIELLGVTGTMEASENVTAQAATATPSLTEQTILPGTGYDYLSQVTVAAISRTDSDNSAGGTTVTIAG